MVSTLEFTRLNKGDALFFNGIAYQLLERPRATVHPIVSETKVAYYAPVALLDIAFNNQASHLFCLDDQHNSFALYERSNSCKLDSSYPQIKTKPKLTTNALKIIK